MKVFRFVFRSAPGPCLLAAALAAASGGGTAALLALIHRLLGALPDHETSQTVAFLILLPTSVLLAVAGQMLLLALGHRMTARLRSELPVRILGMPLRELERRGPANLLAVLTEDIGRVSGAVPLVPGVIMSSAVVVACMGYLTVLSPLLSGVLVASIALGVLGFFALRGVAMRRYVKSRQLIDGLFESFRGLTYGFKELEMNAPMRASFVDELREVTGQIRATGTAASWIVRVANGWASLALFGALGALVIVPHGVGADVVQAFVISTLFMQGALESIILVMGAFAEGSVALDRIELLDASLRQDRVDRPAAEVQPRAFSSIELSQITYTYESEEGDRTFRLGPIDLSIRPADILFIVGGNGSGKTSLAKLLAGLYTPDGGTLRLNGEPVGLDTLDFYRQHFSVVFSDFYLFERLHGLPPAHVQAMAETYLRRLDLHHKVEIQGDRLSTTSLSQGQRKRLALLRALLEDRPVYLFDEWAADQDPEFKRVFYREVLPELKHRGKAVVAISHDDAYFDAADRVIKLQDGQLDPAATPPVDRLRSVVEPV